METSGEKSCGHVAWNRGDGGVRASEPLRHMAPSQVGEKPAGHRLGDMMRKKNIRNRIVT